MQLPDNHEEEDA